MNFLLKSIILIFVTLTIGACRSKSDFSREFPVELSSYVNKFGSVLLHYQGKADSLKRRAAVFLITNMEDKFSYKGMQYDLFVHFIDSLSKVKISDEEYKQVVLDYYSQFGTLAGNKILVSDLDSLTPELLARNIDEAFNAWQNAPWRQQVSFSDFCEFVLPYRVGDEPLEDFRKPFLHQFEYLFKDSSLSLRAAADSVLKVTSRKTFDIITYPESVPDFPASRLIKMRAGSCRDVSCLSTFIMRSLAIPVANDFTPQWPHRGLGHDWSALVLPKDSCIDFEGANSPKLGGHLRLSYKNRMAKAYRHTFSKQFGSLAMIHGTEVIPDFFLNPYLRDVSSNYFNGSAVIVNIPDSVKNAFAYLCVFDNESWAPIQWAKIEHSKAVFRDMGRNVIYLPALFSSRGLSPLSPPIFLDSNGRQHFIVPDMDHRTIVHLKRKYPVFDWWNTRMLAMKNGYFQLSNNDNFTNAITVYHIRELPEMAYQSVNINSNKTYRYFRYVSPDSSYGEVAEIAVFDRQGNKLHGKIMSTEPDNPTNGADMAFDANALSFFVGKQPNNNWIGLAFNRPETVSKIEFLCRNDDNFIRAGELYELYCWLDNDWKSLGRQVGKEGLDLVFKDIPEKALLLLRDHTKGKEERIFTYEEGKQVWW